MHKQRNTVQNKVTNISEIKYELSAERSAQVDCVLRLLKNFIEKLRICLLVPIIISKSEKSNEITETKYRLTFKILEKYLEEKNFQSKGTPSTEKLLRLMEYIDEHLEELNLLPIYTPFQNENDKYLILMFTWLYNITEQRLPKSALHDLTKENKLLKLNRSLNDIEKSIAEYTENLRKKRIIRRWNLAYKGGLIQKYEEQLAYQKWDNNLRIQQEIVRSSKNIQTLQTLSNEILEELTAEAIKKRTAYNKLLRENLELEREARMEKKKLLFQLQTYIRKFDKNVGEKIKENLHLQEDYDAKKKSFDQFMIEYLREENEYKIIQRQKEKEDQLIFEQKLMVFMMGRAARVIQVYWRRFRRDQKKKSKRGKGKSKRK